VSEFEQYIDNDIPKLPWHEHIRLRPGMYLGTVNSAGFTALLIELFCTNFQPRFEISRFQLHIIGEKSAALTLESEDISVPTLRHSFTHAPVEFVLMVLAALSTKLEVKLFGKNDQGLFAQTFEEGILTSNEAPTKCPSGSKLSLTFQLDELIWGKDFSLNEDFIVQQLRDLAFLAPTTRFEVRYSKFGEKCRSVFQFRNGLKDYLEYLSLDGLGSTRLKTAFKLRADDFVLDVAFGIRRYSVDRAFLKSYANCTYTFHDGTHVTALFQGIATGLKLYLDKYAFSNDYDLSEENLRKTLIGGISVVLEVPSFAGATKSKLANEEIIEPISTAVAHQFLISLEADKVATEDFIRYGLAVK